MDGILEKDPISKCQHSINFSCESNLLPVHNARKFSAVFGATS